MDAAPSSKGPSRASLLAGVGVVVVVIAAIVATRRPQTVATRRPNAAASRPNTAAARPDTPRPSTASPAPDAAPPSPSAAPRYREHMGALFESERPVVAPLTIGAALGPTTIFEIAHHADARIMVGVRVATREGWLRINASQGGAAPTGTVEGPFAITSEDGALTSTERDAAVAALAAVLRRNVAVPVPREMQPLGGPTRADAGRDAS